MHDIPQIHLTYQDERTTEQAKYYYKISIEKLQNIYEERIETSKKGQNIDLLIHKRKNQKVLGTCTFKGIDPKKSSGEFGIMIHHNFWGTKSVLESIYLCFEFFYETLKHSKIETAAFTTNKRSRALMKHIDIPLHSIKKDVMLLEGEYKDDACYIISIEQWPKIKTYLRDLLYRKNKPDIYERSPEVKTS